MNWGNKEKKQIPLRQNLMSVKVKFMIKRITESLRNKKKFYMGVGLGGRGKQEFAHSGTWKLCLDSIPKARGRH